MPTELGFFDGASRLPLRALFVGKDRRADLDVKPTALSRSIDFMPRAAPVWIECRVRRGRARVLIATSIARWNLVSGSPQHPQARWDAVGIAVVLGWQGLVQAQ